MADALSRIGTNALHTDHEDSPPVIDLKAIVDAQADDPELQHLQAYSSLKLEQVPLAGSDATIVCDVSTGVSRPYVSPEFRRAVFEALPALSHPGIRATSAPDNITLCLARDQFRHQEMGTDLSPMSAVQGTPAYSSATHYIRNS